MWWRQALAELLEDDDRFGFIVMDGNGTLYGTLQVGHTGRHLGVNIRTSRGFSERQRGRLDGWKPRSS